MVNSSTYNVTYDKIAVRMALIVQVQPAVARIVQHVVLNPNL